MAASSTSRPIPPIARANLAALPTPTSATITAVQPLSSYNWLSAPAATPTIAAPGSPDLWAPPASPLEVPKDTGKFFIAQNAARHPSYPLEPLFRALYLSEPAFDISAVDVVTDRNNIRKLLSFVNPRGRRDKEDFTIRIEMEKDTVIFCRDETAAVQYIGPGQAMGYGHSFESACTRKVVQGSTGHHRILTYLFGGMRLLVRHETDGFVGDAGAEVEMGDLSMEETQLRDARSQGATAKIGGAKGNDEPTQPSSSAADFSTNLARKSRRKKKNPVKEAPAIDEIADALGALDVSVAGALPKGRNARGGKAAGVARRDNVHPGSKRPNRKTQKAKPPAADNLTPAPALTIRKDGTPVPLTSTLEIKTRVAKRPLRLADVVVQLWASQTPRLVRAYHTDGSFAVPHPEDMRDKIAAWEAQNQDDLRRLAGLFGRIRDVVREAGGSAVLRYDVKADMLVFEQTEGRRMLPGDLYGRWGVGGGALDGEKNFLGGEKRENVLGGEDRRGVSREG